MSIGGRRARLGYSLAIAVLLATAFSIGMKGVVVTAKAAPPVGMGFGPNQLTPSGQGTNEPQITVDQSGRAYLTWQGDGGAFPGTRVTWTTDGSSFNSNEYPDPTSGVTALGGDVTLTTTNWPSLTDTPPLDNTGSNGVFWSDLATASTGTTASCAGDPQVRAATSINQESAGVAATDWINPNNAGCQPLLVDRQWMDAYTPPAFRGTANAKANTILLATYHDLGSSAIWLTRSFNGGASWQATPFPVPVTNQANSVCNTIPGGLAIDKSGLHPGRVYLTWETSDPIANPTTGCNYTQAQPFDHIYLAYSDDAQTCTGGPSPNGCIAPTFTQATIFNDPCSPGYPVSQDCQDVSEFFAPVAVDDAGTPYVAYVRYNLTDPNPEYDVYLANGSFSGSTLSFPTTHKVSPPGSGTHYQPALVAGQAGAVEVAYYGTTTHASGGPAPLNKPLALPNTALFFVYLSQSFDSGATFTQNQVSNASNYYGDVCNTGIFCGNGSTFGWGDDRILFEDFGLAVGPDGGARLDWTDSRNSGCVAGTNATMCQGGKTQIFFACQTSGLGIHGETMTGCGLSQPAVQTPEVPWVPGLMLAAAGSVVLGMRKLRRSGRGGPTPAPA
jgi:hypothetical protein